jgi:hypothetical protein
LLHFYKKWKGGFLYNIPSIGSSTLENSNSRHILATSGAFFITSVRIHPRFPTSLAVIMIAFSANCIFMLGSFMTNRTLLPRHKNNKRKRKVGLTGLTVKTKNMNNKLKKIEDKIEIKI